MVTFETKVWEDDWKYILMGDYLDKMIANCNYDFKYKTLIINNVKDRRKVAKYAERKKNKGIIDNYYFAEDHSEEVLRHFEINRDQFNGGYYYSIAELTGIYFCKTEYLLHFSSDSFMVESKVNWIDSAIEIFKKSQDIIIANPTWDYLFETAKEESFKQIERFYIGSGFSDQCYLIKTDIFKKNIYNEKHIDSERYPEYGGELFEKRVDSYIKNNNLYRITSMDASYIHKNFIKYKRIYKINFFLKKYARERFKI